MLADMTIPVPWPKPPGLVAALAGPSLWWTGWRQLAASASGLLDPWLPRACALCEAPVMQARAGLCRHCRLALPGRERPRCTRCGLGLTLEGACAACEASGFAFEAACVLADYAPPLDRLIGALKFGGQFAAAEALGREMAVALRRFQAGAPSGRRPVDLVVAVPLSKARRQQRGYDQAQAIARALGRSSGIAHRPSLVRVRQTDPQTTLPRLARTLNLRDAFGPLAGRRLDGAHIALVDDVMTTGATLDAAARALRQAGASRITAVVAARTA
jgi:ComF family protein